MSILIYDSGRVDSKQYVYQIRCNLPVVPLMMTLMLSPFSVERVIVSPPLLQYNKPFTSSTAIAVVLE